jgi:hypothetical protein
MVWTSPMRALGRAAPVHHPLQDESSLRMHATPLNVDKTFGRKGQLQHPRSEKWKGMEIYRNKRY